MYCASELLFVLCGRSIVILLEDLHICPVTGTKCHNAVVAAVKGAFCPVPLKEVLSSENNDLPCLPIFHPALGYGFSTDKVHFVVTTQ